ncbi:LysR family transcriptional regulator [Nitratireductor sp. ZSWI3]|uniref:LysR family transcriptional regulator n=1 Tax=Nitratireductor sp. ZSWI3 TaxID=2966359 RepID=UPI00214FDB05|nr:LysR family transcriptional regulator [Nitratireductor sp. ZSWI3]MCR4265893.1 LysR family transcriptional regulator [Nitratireductor sp. ZSWI3]
MNQRQIQAFRQVMRHGSITAAAQALNVSQPAVSRLIADLERSIGFPLFLRQGGRSEPTTEAREFIQEVERMFYGLDRLGQAAREIKDLRRATLHVATMPMVSFEIVPKALKGLLAERRGIKVTHDVHTSARIVDMVASRQLDLGVAQTHIERRDVEFLASYRTYCVCALSPDHPLGGRDVLTPRDLRGEPLVALAHHTLTANYVTQSFAEANVNPNIAIESQPSYSACGLAAMGVGIAIVDPMTPRVFRENLRAIPFEPQIPFDFHIVKPADLPLSRAAEEFRVHLLETLASFSDIHALA